MRIRLNYITPLLAAGAAAAAIAAAPTAMAATVNPAPVQQACHNGVCPNSHTTLAGPLPGDVELNDSPGPVQYSPLYPYWEGDSYGGYGHGGFGGGFGGGHGGGGHGK
jgi:hypothetical protein